MRDDAAQHVRKLRKKLGIPEGETVADNERSAREASIPVRSKLTAEERRKLSRS